jgi:antitoxin HicB
LWSGCESASWLAERLTGAYAMAHYIALIHKDADSCYGVSFPDWAGVITAGDTIDEAMQQAAEALTFAAEDWENRDGFKEIPKPRTIDELRADPMFRDDAADAVVAAVPFRIKAEAAE